MLLIHAYKCKLPSAESLPVCACLSFSCMFYPSPLSLHLSDACLQPDQRATTPSCKVRYCHVMKSVLEHMAKCQLGRKCDRKSCRVSTQSISAMADWRFRSALWLIASNHCALFILQEPSVSHLCSSAT